MQYGELITRSFRIVWRHRYLWLLAILGGADVNQAGFNASYRQSTQTAGSYPAQVTQFLHDHLGLILAGVSLAVVFALVYFLLSCVTTGALVRASAEHDAERPFGFGLAWRVGLGRFWSILGLRLLGILIVLVILAVLGLLALFGFLAYQAGQSGALALVVLVGVLLIMALIPAAIVAGIVWILATRSVVLEERGTMAALSRALGLLRARLGRVLLVWLMQVALGIAAAIAVAIPVLVLVLIVGGVILGLAVGVSVTAALVVGVPLGLVALAVLIVLGGITGAYFSTYWTLAFRRLELDIPRPTPAWPPTAYPPQPPAG